MRLPILLLLLSNMPAWAGPAPACTIPPSAPDDGTWLAAAALLVYAAGKLAGPRRRS